VAVRDDFAPYAPVKAVLAVINRFRERGLPDPLTVTALEQVGIAPSMSSRTHQALRFLGLVDEGGNRLEAFERLRRAASDEYQAQLGHTVREAYTPIFTIVDPASDDDVALVDAFRRYEPAAQREKMVALFRGLCEAAGIISASRPRGVRPSASAAKARRAPTSKAQVKEPTTGPATSHMREGDEAVDLRLVSAIIQQLPRDGRWPRERRERWIAAMISAVDLVVELTADATDKEH
jgi:hypothetical protein